MADDAVRMRWACPGDAERIADYHHACWRAAFEPLLSAEVIAAVEPRHELFRSWLADDSDLVTVVAVDGSDRPIGHTTVSADKLVHLFVDPEYHRRGFGRQLLEVGERLIRQAGHRQAQLQTRVGNDPAIALYQSCGWLLTEETAVDVLPNGDSVPEHVMRKDFDARGYVQANRETWDNNAANWVDRGRQSWTAPPHWGEMAIPESQVQALPELAGRDMIELGCGTGYVSAWCLQAGARSAISVDNSLAQLRSAQLLQTELDLAFPLVWANAERVPLASGICDVVINEYGAALWCDPYAWIPEAARLLRPGGNLMFLTWSTLMSMMAPDFDHQHTSTRLLRPQRGLRQVGFPDTDGVEFVLSHGEWVSLLTANGFVVDRLIELYAPAEGPERYSYYDAAWAKLWPPEEIWCATYLG